MNDVYNLWGFLRLDILFFIFYLWIFVVRGITSGTSGRQYAR